MREQWKKRETMEIRKKWKATRSNTNSKSQSTLLKYEKVIQFIRQDLNTSNKYYNYSIIKPQIC